MMKIVKSFISALLIVSLSIGLFGCGKKYSCEDFTVYDKNLDKVELEDSIGKPIVVNFWATWCYYCKVEMPDFEEAYKEHSDVVFMMVNCTDGVQETVDIASGFIAEEGYTFPVYYDIDIDAVQKYEISSYPTTFFIDKNGDVVKKHVGMITPGLLEIYIDMITD